MRTRRRRVRRRAGKGAAGKVASLLLEASALSCGKGAVSSIWATALAVHVKFIIPICNQNGAPDEYQFVGAMPGHGSGAHSNERSHKAMQTQSSHVHRHALRAASTAFWLFLTVLGIAVFFRLASPAAVELARPINPPLTDVPNSTGQRNRKSGFCRRLFLGRSGGVPAYLGRDERGFGICGRHAGRPEL